MHANWPRPATQPAEDRGQGQPWLYMTKKKKKENERKIMAKAKLGRGQREAWLKLVDSRASLMGVGFDSQLLPSV
ncbi:hypothetical protein AMTR_s00015p00258130 [Amborella trichopoda]|uniref:Uncharacterized protein n=1 Tax=Amborella trichopoda TaxID=13333 RepID=W1PML2_AMBTC|nr:hypothetical protein AMTR_s00015p00258130 [Amborella trichopoda]